MMLGVHIQARLHRLVVLVHEKRKGFIIHSFPCFYFVALFLHGVLCGSGDDRHYRYPYYDRFYLTIDPRLGHKRDKYVYLPKKYQWSSE
jgi:hypothetical protein